MKHRIIPFLILSLLPLSSCQDNSMKSAYLYLFDTYADIRIYDGTEEDVKSISSILENISQLTDPYIRYSGKNNICTINNTEEEVTIDETLAEFLHLCFEVSEEKPDYLNPFIGSLSSLWKADLEKGKIPSDEEIQSLLSEMKETSLSIEQNKAKRIGKATLDSGAFAKGYALKKTKEYLDQKGIRQYLISLGGSSILAGEKPGSDKGFSIKSRELGNMTFTMKNCAIGISSVSEQTYEIDGKRYSHILSPKTGKTDLASDYVLIKGEDSFLLDCYSTMFTLKGYEGIEAYEKEGYSFIFSDLKNITYSTEGIL